MLFNLFSYYERHIFIMTYWRFVAPILLGPRMLREWVVMVG